MKISKLKYMSLGFVFTLLVTVGCKNEEGLIKPYESYSAIPQTEVATKVVNNSNLIATINHDTTYVITTGVNATEIRYLSTTGLSMKVFLVEVDLNNPSIKIEASTPNNAPAFGMQKMTQQATYEDYAGHKVWAGINADFYNMTSGVPQGILHKEGLALKTSVQDEVNTFFAIKRDGKAVIGDQDDYALLKSDLLEAVGGRVMLLKDGTPLPQTDLRLEPRTCIGVNEAGTKVYMLVVDGRNFHYSNGMNYDDLAQFMKAVGAYHSINLDGGGSSTFFTRTVPGFDEGRFVVRNWPYDGGGVERSVANGLVVVSTDN